MGAAANIQHDLAQPAALEAYEKQHKELGDNPSTDKLLNTRLVPDPRRVRLRVYQTNSTHKSMSAIRQGSMVLVKDVDHAPIAAQWLRTVLWYDSEELMAFWSQPLVPVPAAGPAPE